MKDLKEKKVLFTSKGNCGGCFSNNHGSRGTKRGIRKEDLLGKKIEGLCAGFRFDDIGTFQFKEGLKIGGFEVITWRRRFRIRLICKFKEPL